MENLSQVASLLSERIKSLISAFSRQSEENCLLKEKIFQLENELSNLKLLLEEKRSLLDFKNEEMVFLGMIFDDLLSDITSIESRFFIKGFPSSECYTASVVGHSDINKASLN